MCEGEFRAAWALPDDRLHAELVADFFAAQRLLARVAELAADAERRELPSRAGATRTETWLVQLLGCSRSEATHLTQLGHGLVHDGGEGQLLHSVADAVFGGRIGVEQARLIAKTVTGLPKEIDPQARERCAELLTKLAVDDNVAPEQLERHRKAILEQVAPEIAEKALRKQLEDQERSAYQRRQFTVSRHGPGECLLRGILPTEAAAIVKAAMDPLCAPGALTPFPDPAADAVADADGGAADPVVRDGRSPAARRADALVEICRRVLAQGELPDNGGEKPHLVITIDWKQLREGLAGAMLDTGEMLSPETVRRLACDSLVIPAILNGQGQPLDVGRARRLIDGPLRRALVLRDRGCAFPGCDRPPRWCEGHHVLPWIDGGTTCLGNSVLLCTYHHHLIHRTDWTVRIAGDGHPEFIPPAHLDPDRRPRRNTIHH
jgi:hypothetical protein